MNCLEEILELYAPYIADPQYVYKLCNDQWIIIMRKLPCTQTNEKRKNVRDPRYAKFRADRLEVCVIFSVDCPTHKKDCTVNCFGGKELLYKVNQVVVADSFDQTLDNICSHGIHYFQTLDRAYYYRDMASLYTGPWIRWQDNGLMVSRCNYLDGEKSGQCSEWYVDGTYRSLGQYLNGRRTGGWLEWDDGGHSHTLHESYYSNGQRVY